MLSPKYSSPIMSNTKQMLSIHCIDPFHSRNPWTRNDLLCIPSIQHKPGYSIHPMMTSSNGNIFRVTGPLSPVNSPHKGQWRGALLFSLICDWINGRVNNCEAGDLRRHRAHYSVTVMLYYTSAWLSAGVYGYGEYPKYNNINLGDYNHIDMHVCLNNNISICFRMLYTFTYGVITLHLHCI